MSCMLWLQTLILNHAGVLLRWALLCSAPCHFIDVQTPLTLLHCSWTSVWRNAFVCSNFPLSLSVLSVAQVVKPKCRCWKIRTPAKVDRIIIIICLYSPNRALASPFWGFVTINFLRVWIVSPAPNPQPGGPGLRIYDPRRQGGPAIPPGTGYPF
jgi:hypothetical protein